MRYLSKMNLLERKNDCQVIQWKPFATSTPLKSISINAKVTNRNYPVRATVYNQGLTKIVSGVSKNHQNKLSVESKIENRIIGRNKSRAYFDLSSSSDDDGDYKIENRPVIKIGAENTGRSKVVAINENYSRRIGIAKDSSGIKTKIGAAKFQHSKCESQQKQKNKAEDQSGVPNISLENVNSSQNHEKSLPIGVNNLGSEKKKSLCAPSKFTLRNKQRGKPVTTVNGTNTALEVDDENNKNSKTIPRILKRKDIGGRNFANTKPNTKKRKEVQTVSPKKWANSSHQLFTDSVQEELISTLCLISPEVDEFVEDLNFSKLDQKSSTKLGVNKAVKISNSEENKVVKEFERVAEKQQRPKITKLKKNETGKAGAKECEAEKKSAVPVALQGRPKRTRQAPKKYWLVNDMPKLLKEESKCIRPPRKKHAIIHEQVSDQVLEAAGKNLMVTAPESKKSSSPRHGLNNSDSQGIEKFESRFGTKKDKSLLIDTKFENSSKQPVFLPLNKISFLENELGHQVRQIWSANSFNCEIFKLKPGSNFTWKSSESSNYMGGVLIKGTMKMTIEGKDSILHEGDMVVIPPLSKYQATNISEYDLIFYYWTYNKCSRANEEC